MSEFLRNQVNPNVRIVGRIVGRVAVMAPRGKDNELGAA